MNSDIQSKELFKWFQHLPNICPANVGSKTKSCAEAIQTIPTSAQQWSQHQPNNWVNIFKVARNWESLIFTNAST